LTNFNCYDPASIKKIISDRGLNVQKKYGQNFLINEKIADLITSEIDINKNAFVAEIGCGLGSLTKKLVDRAKTFIGFEIDKGYVEILNEIFSTNNNFQLIEGNFLKKSKPIFRDVKEDLYEKKILVGNLPYNLTREIFEYIFSGEFVFDKVYFMIQKEVLKKITASPGDERYSYMSIISQINKDINEITHLSKNDFYPSPEVDSVFVSFIKNEKIKILNKKLFFRIAKSIFINRRKKIINNFKLSPFLNETEKYNVEKTLFKVDISPDARGETLSLQQIADFSNNLYPNV